MNWSKQQKVHREKASGEATGGLWKFGPTAQLANRMIMSGKRKPSAAPSM